MEWISAQDMHTQLSDLGCNYPVEALVIAAIHGYNHQSHIDALLSMNDDEITLTHPINFLTEDESERYFSNASH